MYYLLLKFIHVITSTILFGTGLGSAFYFYRAHKSRNIRAMYFAARNVVIADWIFTTPAVILQPLTGILLMNELGISYSTPWIVISLVLYALVGVCWLPVVWLQIKMRIILNNALTNNDELSPSYYKYYRLWFFLGWPAFILVIVIFYLMIFKAYSY